MPLLHSISRDQLGGLLADIASPPLLLHCAGDIALLEATDCVAVVGTRHPDHEEERLAHDIGRALAIAGIPVVSGLALGVDGAAHHGCLEGGGRTVAFLGSGMRRIHPRRHLRLASQITERGGLVCSELDHDETATPQRLVARNRLVSGLSCAVIVVSSGADGGTMHTVRFAFEQGRPVWCPRADGIGGVGVKLLLEVPASEAPESSRPLRPLQRCELGNDPLASGFEPDEKGLQELVEVLRRTSTG